jgi:hypothetical protein
MFDDRRARILSCASRIGNSPASGVVGQLEFWPGCPLQHVPPILAVEAVEGAFGGDIDYAMLIKMFGAVPEATKGRRPGGFGGDSSIFAPCSLEISEQNRRWRIKISRAAARVETAGTKKPGAVSRPGTTRQFQFHG